MRKTFSFFLLFTVLFAGPVFAEPQCGRVEEDIVEDLFDAIDRIDNYYDIEEEAEGLCAIAEGHYEWERDQPSNTLDRDYREKRDGIIKDIEQDMQSLTGYLMELRGWIYYDAVGGVAEAKRIAHIRSTKKDINFHMINLDGIVTYLDKLRE